MKHDGNTKSLKLPLLLKTVLVYLTYVHQSPDHLSTIVYLITQIKVSN